MDNVETKMDGVTTNEENAIQAAKEAKEGYSKLTHRNTPNRGGHFESFGREREEEQGDLASRYGRTFLCD